MATDLQSRVWFGICIYLVASTALIYVALLPINMGPASWAGPDWLLLLALVVVIRRPKYAPVLAIALVFLLADFIFQRPPALWTVLVVWLTELLRKRAPGFRSMPFSVEWTTVAGMILAVFAVNRLFLAILIMPLPPLGLVVMQAVATALAYPIVSVLSRLVMGLRRTSVGELDARGQRL